MYTKTSEYIYGDAFQAACKGSVQLASAWLVQLAYEKRRPAGRLPTERTRGHCATDLVTHGHWLTHGGRC